MLTPDRDTHTHRTGRDRTGWDDRTTAVASSSGAARRSVLREEDDSSRQRSARQLVLDLKIVIKSVLGDTKHATGGHRKSQPKREWEGKVPGTKSEEGTYGGIRGGDERESRDESRLEASEDVACVYSAMFGRSVETLYMLLSVAHSSFRSAVDFYSPRWESFL